MPKEKETVMANTATARKPKTERIVSRFDLLMAPDQKSLDMAVLLSRFGIAFTVSSAAAPNLNWHGKRREIPALYEETVVEDTGIPRDRAFYRTQAAVRNFIRDFALREDDGLGMPRLSSRYDQPRIDFMNTSWPERTSGNRYTPIWCFDEKGDTLFKGDVRQAPIPVVPVLEKSRVKVDDQGDIAAWRICPLKTLQEHRSMPFVSKNPPAVLMPDEVEELSQDDQTLVVKDDGGFNGMAWSTFDAYFTHCGWLYRVWTYFQD